MSNPTLTHRHIPGGPSPETAAVQARAVLARVIAREIRERLRMEKSEMKTGVMEGSARTG